MAIEQHGIDAIPKQERTKRWWDLFTIQAGIAFSFPTLVIGSLLAPGLSWPHAVWAILIGNIILTALVALVGYYGVDYGVSASVASRFTLGHPAGTRLCSALLLVSLVGWFAVINELAGLAVDGIVKSAFGFSSPATCIILVGVLNAIPAVMGFEEIKFLNRLAVPALAFLAAWMLKVIFSAHGYRYLTSYQASGQLTFNTGLDWIVGGFIVGVFIAPDYSRYVRSRSDNWVGCLLGVFPPAVLLGITGMLSRLATQNQNPVASVQSLGLGLTGLLLTVLSTLPSSEASLYSAGLALTNVFPKQARWKNTVIVTACGIVLAVFGITEHLGDFLTSLSYVFSPLVGVSLCDYFILRRRLDLEEAYRDPTKGKRFWNRGVNGAAIVAILAGIAVSAAAASRLPAALTGLFVGAIAYYAIEKQLRFKNSTSLAI
ncbi:MAG: purine-cytosine permease family protein [Terriglobales bacterium]